jgi:hypothetical protein
MINLPLNVDLANKTYEGMCRQERYGVAFNSIAATELTLWIDKRMEGIRIEVESKLPKRPLNTAETRAWTPPKIQFKKDGTISAVCLKWFESIEGTTALKAGVSVNLPHHEPIIDSLPMELKHQNHIKDWLLTNGWIPTLWNLKKGKDNKPMRDPSGKVITTTPKFHENGRICPNLERLGTNDGIIKPIIEWLSLRNRRSVLLNEGRNTGWLANSRLAIDGRLSAASSGLTNTKRQKHTVVANVPRVTSLLGEEMRSLFVASDGMVLVGADASGLEARVKGHYTYHYDGGEYANKLLDDNYDEHSENAELWGCSRQDAKSPAYALQYNCQPAKFAETLGVSLSVGKEHYNAYWKKNWALAKAVEEAEKEYENNHQKFITTIDGGKIVTRSKHSVFNAKCQSTGAKIMDMAGVIADDFIKERGLPANRVIYYHDELQYETTPELADEVGHILVRAMEIAGKQFKLNVPITGDYKIGQSWRHTH